MNPKKRRKRASISKERRRLTKLMSEITTSANMAIADAMLRAAEAEKKAEFFAIHLGRFVETMRELAPHLPIFSERGLEDKLIQSAPDCVSHALRMRFPVPFGSSRSATPVIDTKFRSFSMETQDVFFHQLRTQLVREHGSFSTMMLFSDRTKDGSTAASYYVSDSLMKSRNMREGIVVHALTQLGKKMLDEPVR